MELTDLLALAIEEDASDLHIITGQPPALRVGGKLTRQDSPVLSTEEVIELLRPHVSQDQLEMISAHAGDVELFIRCNGRLFRGCTFREFAGVGAAFRQIPQHIPTLNELYATSPEQQVKDTLQAITRMDQGLVVVAGPSGSGKCTTAAGLVDTINRECCKRIMVIDNVMDYEFCSHNSIVTQHIIGRDVASFNQAAFTAMNADANVVYVGELLSMEMMRLALGLAETGHLVFAVLNANGASEAIERMSEVFPEPRDTIRRILARNLVAVLSQRLLKRSDKPGRVAVLEVLLKSARIQQQIAAGEPDFTPAIEAESGTGMQSMEQAVNKLVGAGIISAETAAAVLSHRG